MDAKAKRVIVWTAAIAALLVAAAILNHLGVLPDKERDCRERGETYFKDIGSWPRLSDGRWAIDVAKERCSRNSSAF